MAGGTRSERGGRRRAAGGRAVPELLAPAGSYDAALAALAAGADAVYTGLAEPGLDARAAAPGLSWEELARACALAHVRGARVYVTLNALARTGEIGRAVEAARRALSLGADALIVADLGLISRLAAELPSAELHLSTQAGVQAAPAAQLAAKRLGCSRVTVARELSVAEIAAVCATGVEVEAFCHGAICISYSGACAHSALTRGRSAMRGDCTQPCRQPWRLVDGRGRPRADAPGDKLLCPRDYLGLRVLPELVTAGVGALKIEGRMKNPDYVFNVVGAYRAALDAIAAGADVPVAELEARLGRSFNRGFTDAYPCGDAAATGRPLMSFERSCNQGVRVGEVTARAHREVTVSLTGPVAAGDTLEIHTVLPADAAADVPRRWPLVPCPVDADTGDRIVVRCKRRVAEGSAVFLTASAAVLTASAQAVARLREEADSLPAPAPDVPAPRPAAPRGSGPVPPVGGGAALPSPRFARTAAEAAGLIGGGAAEVAVEAWRTLDDEDAWEPLLPRITVLLDEVCRARGLARAERLCLRAARVVCRNLSQVALARGLGVAFDAAAPIYVENADAAETVRLLGACRIWVPDELPASVADELAASCAAPIGRLALPATELMVMQHCVLTAEGPCDHRCRLCARRAAERFLVDARGERFRVITDRTGRSRIFRA